MEEGRTGAEGEKKGGKEGERKVTSGFLSRRTVIFGAAVPGESADAEQWQSPKKELSWQGAPSPVQSTHHPALVMVTEDRSSTPGLQQWLCGAQGWQGRLWGHAALPLLPG